MLFITIVCAILAARVIEKVTVAAIVTIRERSEQQRETEYLEKLSKRQTVNDE